MIFTTTNKQFGLRMRGIMLGWKVKRSCFTKGSRKGHEQSREQAKAMRRWRTRLYITNRKPFLFLKLFVALSFCAVAGSINFFGLDWIFLGVIIQWMCNRNHFQFCGGMWVNHEKSSRLTEHWEVKIMESYSGRRGDILLIMYLIYYFNFLFFNHMERELLFPKGMAGWKCVHFEHGFWIFLFSIINEIFIIQKREKGRKYEFCF